MVTTSMGWGGEAGENVIELTMRAPQNDNQEKLPNNGWWMVPVFICGLLLVLAIMGYHALAGEAITGRAMIIDGDTIEIHGQRIRLAGVDTPENSQQCTRDGKTWHCGKDATFALADLIDGKPVRCDPAGWDRYGRIVAVCFLGEIELNRWLVEEGWALDYKRYSKGRYADAQAVAKEAGRGLWQGEFIPPWEWRRLKRSRKVK